MVSSTLLTTAVQTLFQPTGANGAANVTLVFCNTTATNQTVTVYAVAAAGSPSATNTILSAVTVPAGETVIFEPKLILGQNESIRALASANTSISATVSYLTL